MNKSTLEVLNKTYPGEVVELKNKANLMNDIIKGMMDNIVAETNSMQDDKKYDEMIQLITVQRELNGIIECNDVFVGKPTEYYNDYEVNVNEPHGLDECFRFKRPFAFQLGNHYQKAHTWKELLIKTCSHLHQLNPEVFSSFAEDNSMQWGKTFNFSAEKNDIREPVIIGDSGIYVETAKDSMGTRQLVIKMLNAFNINLDEYKVYLRADYSPKREYDKNYRKRMK